MTSQDTTLLMRFIERNLPDMPSNFDEGLGIASERYAINKVLLKFIAEHAGNRPVKRVLEAPVDGLMGVPGMNSVILARELDAEVVVGSPSEAMLINSARFWSRLNMRDKVQFSLMNEQFIHPDKSFDWVWNYCTFDHYADAGALLREMMRVSRRYVCVVTQNAYNYGYPIHRLYHMWNQQQWDHGESRWMKMGNLVKLFEASGLNILARGIIDVPPWFDTFDMHTRGEIKKFMKKDNADGWFWSSLQEGDMERLANNSTIQWLERFEARLPFPLDYMFAHHFYLIAEVPQ